MVERIPQRGRDDCQTAVCAMLADEWTYDGLATEYGTPMRMKDIVHALEDEGLYYSMFHNVDSVSVAADFAHYLDRLYLVIESPVSERDPELYHEFCANGTGSGPSFSVTHAVAIRDGEVLDPKPDPYFTCWHDLRESPYEVSHLLAFTDETPRTLDFRSPPT